jgi:hypothetical protein
VSSFERLLSIGLSIWTFFEEASIALFIRIFSIFIDRLLRFNKPYMKSKRICVFAAKMIAVVWSFN